MLSLGNGLLFESFETGYCFVTYVL